MPFRSETAYRLLDADRDLEASLILSDHPDADESDPTVSILDRHYGVSIGVPLSVLRSLVLGVEKAADMHTTAPQVGRLVVQPVTRPAPAPETPEERQAREDRQEVERLERKAEDDRRHEAALTTVTAEETKVAKALTDAAVETLVLRSVEGVSCEGAWRYVRDHQNRTQSVKGLVARELMAVSYYSGGKSSADRTDLGDRVLLALEAIGRIDRDGELVAGWSK